MLNVLKMLLLLRKFPSPCGVIDLKVSVNSAILYRRLNVSVPLRGNGSESLEATGPLQERYDSFRPLAG